MRMFSSLILNMLKTITTEKSLKNHDNIFVKTPPLFKKKKNRIKENKTCFIQNYFFAELDNASNAGKGLPEIRVILAPPPLLI